MSDGEIQRVLDTRALEIAVESRTMIMSHLRDCERRSNDIVIRLDQSQRDRSALSDKVDSKFSSVYETMDMKYGELQKTINRGIYYILGTTIVSLGYFLIRFGLPGVHG